MKNWTVKEAVAVINAGKDKEAIKEIVKHFPLFAVIAAAKDFNGLADAMPESLTVRKVETVLNSGATSASTDETDEDIDEADVDNATSEEAGDEDLSSMSTKQLIALCGKRGIKVPKYGKNKQFYLDALNGSAEEPKEEPEEVEEEEDDKEKAIKLFKECKKAGIKVPKGKDAKFYQAKLDELESEDDEDDDWDEDEEVEEKPKKANKKSKKVEPEEDTDDDDDDWDI